VQSYYHGLTLHGVLNVLVWTTFFICGFLPYVAIEALGAPPAARRLGWPTFWLMTGGLVLARGAAGRQRGERDVHVLSAAEGTLGVLRRPDTRRGRHLARHAAARAHLARVAPGESGRPHAAAGLHGAGDVRDVDHRLAGLAAEMLFMTDPWSLGWVGGTDALLARVLFWFTGHPIVYFWLLPAYISWYTLMPRQVGGRLFSDPLARASFLLFLVLSTPLGFHHQYTDPASTRAGSSCTRSSPSPSSSRAC
jgi:cytochrome c oxidase subunit 1